MQLAKRKIPKLQVSFEYFFIAELLSMTMVQNFEVMLGKALEH
jgi:hypothetical protein